jgi:hypothetical protein
LIPRGGDRIRFRRVQGRKGINQPAIVSHGVAIRVFLMRWPHRPCARFEREEAMGKASIRMIHGQADRGRIPVEPQQGA